jgi:hypothetical protein
MFKFLTRFKKCPPYWNHCWHIRYLNKMVDKPRQGCEIPRYKASYHHLCCRCAEVKYICINSQAYQ